MSKPLVQVTVAGFEPRRPGFQVNALHPTLCCSPVGDSGRSVSEELKGFLEEERGSWESAKGMLFQAGGAYVWRPEGQEEGRSGKSRTCGRKGTVRSLGALLSEVLCLHTQSL